VDPVSVFLSGTQSRQETVPYTITAFGKRKSPDLVQAKFVEQAQLHALGVRRVERKINTIVMATRSQRRGHARAHRFSHVSVQP
jgi:hypothetical protein